MRVRSSLAYLSLGVVALLDTVMVERVRAQRVTGFDVSAWQGNISQSGWNTSLSTGGRQFVFIRATRGGTTGYDQRHDGLSPGDAYHASQRHDDPYFGQNITRATAAGLFAGTYHFSRPDILASTLNSNGTTAGVANNGTDEANHMIQMAGAWMRPGYLPPTFDLETGSGSTHVTQFALDFSNRIYNVMGIRPAMYINGNYSNIVAGASATLRNQLAQPASHGGPSVVSPAYSVLWNARYANEANPGSIPIQTGSPKTTPSTLSSLYGPWDDYGNSQPWTFWQYASTASIPGISSAMDGNVAQGDIEFVKDKLIPAVWMNNSSGNWSTLANWNSGVTPVAPVVAPNQAPAQGTTVLPTPRLPGAAVAGPTTGLNDTVILERPSANITVTVNSGTHNIRKLYMRESLVISGGSLTVNYNPNYVSDTVNYPNAVRSGPISAQFSGAVTLSGTGALNVHTLQVDSTRTFTVNGGGLTFDRINLMPHSSTPAKILVSSGGLNATPLGSATATIANGAGGGSSGFVDLGGGNRTFNVANGSAGIDMAVNVPIVNGSLTKSGAGTLLLAGTQGYNGTTTVSGGVLRVGGTYFNSSAAVSVASGASLGLFYSGSQNYIDSLTLGGAAAQPGMWGSPTSGAPFTSSLLSGNGWLGVGVTPGAGNVIDHFDVNEGHFISAYNLSPQTTGLTSATTIDRVTSPTPQAGAGSQLLNLVASGGAWALRHNSGYAGGVASPSGNTPLEPNGSVGFWLKTDDAGITVQIGIDDPTATSGTGSTALEKGIARSVIADNQWHLYQWNFDDAAEWDAFAGGADGDIDGTFGTVTIDSIFFAGTGSVQVYLDTVSHNPDGPLSGGGGGVPEPSALALLALGMAAARGVSRRRAAEA